MTPIESYRQDSTDVKRQSYPQFTPATHRVREGGVDIGAVSIPSTTVGKKCLPSVQTRSQQTTAHVCFCKVLLEL